jgi:hypothetical protein
VLAPPQSEQGNDELAVPGRAGPKVTLLPGPAAHQKFFADGQIARSQNGVSAPASARMNINDVTNTCHQLGTIRA